MRLLIPICALTAVMGVGVTAQDSTVKSKTTVKADDASVISLTGCLSQDKATGNYTLLGRAVGGGEDLTTKTKVKTDVDKDDTKIEATTKSKSDDAAVGTSGTMSTYVVMPKGDVSLSPHVGHQVQLSAVMLKPGEDDADVKIKEKGHRRLFWARLQVKALGRSMLVATAHLTHQRHPDESATGRSPRRQHG